MDVEDMKTHIKKLLASLNELHPEDCDVDGCAHCERIIRAQDYLK